MEGTWDKNRGNQIMRISREACMGLVIDIQESNCTKTLPGKGWFVYVRLYGVQQALLTKTFQEWNRLDG